MSKKLNITLDDDLYARYQAKKDKVGNISAKCRKVIELELSLIDDDLDFLEKVRIQRRNFAMEDYNFGKSEGYKEAKTFDYADYFELYKWNSLDYKNGEWVELNELPDVFKEYFISFFQDTSIIQPNKDSVFVTGWVSGFLKFWTEIESKLGDLEFQI